MILFKGDVCSSFQSIALNHTLHKHYMLNENAISDPSGLKIGVWDQGVNFKGEADKIAILNTYPIASKFLFHKQI